MIYHKVVTIFILCLVQGSLSKPVESNLTEGRSIASTLWGWISYPFTWGSSEPDLPVNEQLIGSTLKYDPLESIEIAKLNVTVWCNDQTCTTQKCDKFGCKNVTCNIYDTDMMGECRGYNTISTAIQHAPQPTEPLQEPSVQDKSTEAPKVPDSEVTTVAPEHSTPKSIHILEAQPLELEAVLSSTVDENQQLPDNKERSF